jgi:hypothetical protein
MSPRLVGPAAQGLAQLVLRGGKEITDIVAEMHAAIARAPWVFLGLAEPGGGRAPLAYQIVAGAFSALAQVTSGKIEREAAIAEPAGWRRFLGVLNGVLGDHLAAWGNPLAIEMGLRDEAGAPWTLPCEGRVILFVHGSCGTELDWQGPSLTAWVAERRAAGDAVGYLRYDSGLAIEENGRALARLLEPGDARLVFVAHSMGGLVLRSAMALNPAWLPRVSHAAYLGTPHLGAPLERAGRFVTDALGVAATSAPLQRAANVRSRGVKDLAFGAPAGTLPAHVAHLLVGTTLPAPDWVGDGLVPLASAHAEGHDLAPVLQRLRIDGAGHMGMLTDVRVADALRGWLRGG